MRGEISGSTGQVGQSHVYICSFIHLFLSFVFSAFVLACLLKAVLVLAEKSYTWGGPDTSADAVDPNTENGQKFWV